MKKLLSVILALSLMLSVFVCYIAVSAQTADNLKAVAANDSVVRYEAEEATLIGKCGIRANGTQINGFSTGEYDPDSYAMFTVTVPVAGTYNVTVNVEVHGDGSYRVKVGDGEYVGSTWEFTDTSAHDVEISLELKAGENYIYFAAADPSKDYDGNSKNNNGYFFLDYIAIDMSQTIINRYEAEEATLLGKCGIRGNGYQINGFSTGEYALDSYAMFTVTVPVAGTYKVTVNVQIGHMSGDGSYRIKVGDGEYVGSNWEFTDLSAHDVEISLELEKGVNYIYFAAADPSKDYDGDGKNNNGYFFLDYIEVYVPLIAEECTHEWGGDETCDLCGETHEHDWSKADGICTICSISCSHAFSAEDGKCTTCGKGCEHIGGAATCQKGAICDTCGYEYTEKATGVHTSDEFTYVNLGNGTHEKRYACCNALVETKGCECYADNGFTCENCGYHDSVLELADKANTMLDDYFENGGKLTGTYEVTGPEAGALDAYKVAKPENNLGIEYALFNINIDNGLALRHHFIVNTDADYSILVDGEAPEIMTVDGTDIVYFDTKFDGGFYCDVANTITVTVGEETVEYKVSLYSYFAIALEKGDDDVKTLVKALYDFNEATKAAAN